MMTARVWAEYSTEPCCTGGHNRNIVRYHIGECVSLFRIFYLGAPSDRYYVAAGDKYEAEVIFKCVASPAYVFVEAVQVCGDEAERVLCDPAHNIIL